jgi:YHS domain-containing protein
MKMMKHLATAVLTMSFLGSPFGALATDPKAETTIKPYTLKTCVVSDEKLGEMGKAYVFTNGNHEIKLCCKSCLKDFKKDPAKYMKKLEAAEAKAGK